MKIETIEVVDWETVKTFIFYNIESDKSTLDEIFKHENSYWNFWDLWCYLNSVEIVSGIVYKTNLEKLIVEIEKLSKHEFYHRVTILNDPVRSMIQTLGTNEVWIRYE